MPHFHSRARVETTSSEQSHVPLGWVLTESAEFWCKPLTVVARIRLGVAKAVFPYLQRYRRKDLTDTRANVVLAAQTQRDFFLFHAHLIQS
jgi:hypothetical protein